MKQCLPVYVSLLLLLGCHQASNRKPAVDWTAPKSPYIEGFAVTLIGKELCSSRPNTEHTWTGHVPFFVGPFLENQPKYPSTSFVYIGTESGRDHYKVTLNLGEHGKEITKEILYSGSEIEVFQYDDCRVCLRPLTKE